MQWGRLKLLKLGLITGSILLFALSGWIWWRNIHNFTATVQYLELPDARIAYYTRGSGKPLVLIEGYGMTMSNWDPALIRSLAKKYKVIVFDLRDVGLSQGSTGNMTIGVMALDITYLLDHLGIEKADILGWSMGSLIAQEVALTSPEKVDHLILASTFPGDSSTIDATTDAIDTIAGDWNTTIVPLLFSQNALGKEAEKAYLLRTQKAVEIKEQPLSPTVTVKVKSAQEQAMGVERKENNRSAILEKVPSHTLIIAGQNDVLVPIENDKLVTNAIPNSQLTIFPDSGHGFLFQDTNEVVKAITKFTR